VLKIKTFNGFVECFEMNTNCTNDTAAAHIDRLVCRRPPLASAVGSSPGATRH